MYAEKNELGCGLPSRRKESIIQDVAVVVLFVVCIFFVIFGIVKYLEDRTPVVVEHRVHDYSEPVFPIVCINCGTKLDRTSVPLRWETKHYINDESVSWEKVKNAF